MKTHTITIGWTSTILKCFEVLQLSSPSATKFRHPALRLYSVPYLVTTRFFPYFFLLSKTEKKRHSPLALFVDGKA